MGFEVNSTLKVKAVFSTPGPGDTIIGDTNNEGPIGQWNLQRILRELPKKGEKPLWQPGSHVGHAVQ